ncbi:hypothetical protein BDY19DRAFT_1030603 [Irpex rosettiformis]|uniref:Uncharacterized protein n=1 Tax=Irpex rosettiformis TaxID=378272 RepID=A0ACB8UB99_9APHY|nr:hypothetical protein BDY19DRAFT_1030603 [Irpex rosettiformis]
MTALHVYFLQRNQQAFQRLLDSPTRSHSGHGVPGTSSGKSWTRSNPITSACDVNARDSLGRTVLHLAASATDASAQEYVRKLLAHPHINVNLPDRESHWTALHRALYYGNLSTVLLLLQRQEIDLTLKDSEGYTAFDLYNSTVEGTKPRDREDASLRAELLTWGANRNAALGHGDADDRTFPDPIRLEPVGPLLPASARIDERLASVPVRQIVMSKLHTGVVTAESKANLRVCGFGSGGRLGPGQHTQYSLVPMPQLSQTIVSVALGQDHTLAITASGEVLSWGLNRFGQLGYVVEVGQGNGGKPEEGMQATPRKIGGALSKKVVVGVAACKTASACWTNGEVYTWGRNNGQLGYDKNAQPVQMLPRVVPRVSQPVISVAIADNAMACLLDTHDVVCLYNDNQFRVTFPPHGFPSEIKIYRPPQAVRSTSIDKITTCDNVFAALSSNGELFTFSFPDPRGGTDSSSATAIGQTRNRDVTKPQRVWTLRKKFSAVKDVALGSEGSIIVCTESGHVFVKARTTGKATKFQRVPYLQRVVRVCANSTGAFGALRVDAELDPIDIVGNLLKDDLALVQPYLLRPGDTDGESGYEEGEDVLEELKETLDIDEQDESPAITKDYQELASLCRLLLEHKASRGTGPFSEDAGMQTANGNCHGADLVIHVESGSRPRIPAHCAILAARSPVLAEVLAGPRIVEYKQDNVSVKVSLAKQPMSSVNVPLAPWKRPRDVTFRGCHPLTVLILFVYLYTDKVLSIWDWRVANRLKEQLNRLGVDATRVKMELRACAGVFQLEALGVVLEAAFKREVPVSLVKDISPLAFEGSSASPSVEELAANKGHHHGALQSLATDVVLVLVDKEVPCHSVILRARCPLFRAMFDEDVWTVGRWSREGVIRIEFRHMRWAVVKYVVRFLYGEDREIFDVLETVKSAEELIEFMIDVMAVANELLLERLTLICSAIILKRVMMSNASSILVDATHFNSSALVRSVQKYIAQSMETCLECHMLDDLPVDIIKQLAKFVRDLQADKSPLSRSNILVDAAMRRNAEWVELQDFPQLIVPSLRGLEKQMQIGREARVSPPALARKDGVSGSPTVRPQVSFSRLNAGTASMGEDELFVMDGVETQLSRKELPPPSSRDEKEKDAIQTAPSTPSKAGGWKVSSTPRVDMKSIMAEAETSKSTMNRPAGRSGVSPAASTNWRTPPPSSTNLAISSSRGSSGGGSPWKSLPPPAASGAINLSATASASPVHTPPMTPKIKPTRIESETLLHSPQRSGSRSMAQQQTIQPQPQSASSTTSQRPGMGPVISPARQMSWKNTGVVGVRRPSGTSAAWTLPPVQPVVQSSSAGTTILTTPGMSFAAIQQLQLEQGSASASIADKRSLLEIQEEEAARRMEEDFLRWWEAEEERMRVEQQQQAAAASQAQKREQKKKQRQPKVGKDKKGGSSKDGGMEGPSPLLQGEGRAEARPGKDDRKNPSGPNPTPRRKRKPPMATQRQEK